MSVSVALPLLIEPALPPRVQPMAAFSLVAMAPEAVRAPPMTV